MTEYKQEEQIDIFNISRSLPKDISTSRELTFGERLVGVNFNPSGDFKVNRVKELCAELADILYQGESQNEKSEIKNILLGTTYASILNTQMNIVKILTLKY